MVDWSVYSNSKESAISLQVPLLKKVQSQIL
jgi:hypothetical protein